MTTETKMVRNRDPLADGNLWSWVRSVLSQGADIRCDYDSGNVHKTYEAYSARLDCAARERADELTAAIAASPSPPADVAQDGDTERLAWLANQIVAVRTPMRYGSLPAFYHASDPDDGDEFDPDALQKLRAAIDSAKGKGNG
jgi:hypothetical protein